MLSRIIEDIERTIHNSTLQIGSFMFFIRASLV